MNDYLITIQIVKNNEFEDHQIKDNYLEQFKNMIIFLNNNSLINDISIKEKNRLLAAYIGTTLALKKIQILLQNQYLQISLLKMQEVMAFIN